MTSESKTTPAPLAFVLLGLLLGLAALGCGASFVPLRLTEPATGTTGAVRVDVKNVLLTDDILGSGVDDNSGLVIELVVANDGSDPVSVSAASFACLMELDASHPEDTLSLLPEGGGEGPFPGEMPTEMSLLAPVVIPPGQARSYWALFRGYRFPNSELLRRITLRIPAAGGHVTEIVLADPSRGRLRWTTAPPDSGLTLGFENTTLFSAHLRGPAVSTEISRLSHLGRLLWDVGLTNLVLVETEGALTSATSTFMGTGVMTRLALPIVGWGSAYAPRMLDVYAGGAAFVLLETQRRQPVDNPIQPAVYGTLTVEAGLEVNVGAVPLAATPFPLSAVGRTLPRWSLRAGYTHWWVGDGSTDGYTTGVRLSW